MTILRVTGTAGSALSFDLRDILDLLAPRSLKAAWILSAVDAGFPSFDATGPGNERLEAMAQTGEVVSGKALMAAAQDTVQVIWGTFTAYLPAIPGRQWVAIRAIDSDFYEVITEDRKVVSKIEARFNAVSFHDRMWQAAPRDPDVVPFYDLEPIRSSWNASTNLRLPSMKASATWVRGEMSASLTPALMISAKRR
jgi:hypothetical protein